VTENERLYRDALGLDFIKFSNIIMLGYFLKQFSNPNDQLDKLMKKWVERICIFRDTAIKNSAKENDEDPDVLKILSSLHDEFNREEILKDVSTLIDEQVKEVIKNI